MSWSIDPKETGSINDGGSRLPLGKSIHKIVQVTRPVNSKDPTGKEQQVLFETESKGSSYKIYLSPEAASQGASNIAKKTLVGFWQAAGFTEAIKPERLKKLVGKTFELEVIDKPDKVKKNEDGSPVLYRNIQSVNPASEQEEEEQEEEETEDEEPEKQQEEEPENEAPAEKPKKVMPWKKDKK